MNKEQLSSGKERITRALLKYNKKQLSKLIESNSDVVLIDKLKSNIELYKKQLGE